MGLNWMELDTLLDRREAACVRLKEGENLSSDSVLLNDGVTLQV